MGSHGCAQLLSPLAIDCHWRWTGGPAPSQRRRKHAAGGNCARLRASFISSTHSLPCRNANPMWNSESTLRSCKCKAHHTIESQLPQLRDSHRCLAPRRRAPTHGTGVPTSMPQVQCASEACGIGPISFDDSTCRAAHACACSERVAGGAQSGRLWFCTAPRRFGTCSSGRRSAAAST